MSHGQVCAFVVVQAAVNMTVKMPCQDQLARRHLMFSLKRDQPQRKHRDLACQMQGTAWQLLQQLAEQVTCKWPSALLYAAWQLLILTRSMSQRYIYAHQHATAQQLSVSQMLPGHLVNALIFTFSSTAVDFLAMLKACQNASQAHTLYFTQ